MSVELEDRVTRLERRLKRLEFREAFVTQLHDSRRAFATFVLQEDLNENQLQGVASVMESAHNSLSGDAPLSAEEFAEQLTAHIPPKLPPKFPTPAYHFVKSTLMAFAGNGQYTDVYDHFQRSFNVPTLDRLNDE